MITDEVISLCKTLGEMVPGELDGDKDAFILSVFGGEDQKIQCVYGKMMNVGTGFIIGILRYLESLPLPLQRPTLLGMIDTLVKMWEEATGLDALEGDKP